MLGYTSSALQEATISFIARSDAVLVDTGVLEKRCLAACSRIFLFC